jgi:hypothetical protein
VNVIWTFLGGCVFGGVLAWWLFANVHSMALKENFDLHAEVERLQRRIRLIGERAADRSIEP